MAAHIAVRDLWKTFHTKDRKGLRSTRRRVEALRGVNLDVEAGEVFGLLGPNGAGKTTLIKCLTTLLLPTKGTASVNGFDVQKQADQVRASLGCMLMGERGVYWKLTGRENLDYFGALYRVPKPARRKRIEDLIALLAMQEFIDRTAETYSSGQKMILAFAKALIHDAPILILDEPTVTMDVPRARELRRIVRELNDGGKTVFYTTHLMHEAEELCDRVAIIDRGEIIALGTVPELKASLQREDVVTVEGVIPARTVEHLRTTPGIVQATVRNEAAGRTTLSVHCKNSRALLPKVIEILVEDGATVEFLRPQEPTLEDVFIARTGRGLAEDTRQTGGT